MLILSVMPRRGRGMRMPAIMGVIGVVRIFGVFGHRGIVMVLCLSCIAIRMPVARADAQRELHRQHRRSQKCKQV